MSRHDLEPSFPVLAGHGQLALVQAGSGWWRQNLHWGSGFLNRHIKNRLLLFLLRVLRLQVFCFGVLLRAQRYMVCNLQRIRLRVIHRDLLQQGDQVLLLDCDDTNGM